MKNPKKPVIIAISGLKNFGKTMLIEMVIPQLKKRGLKVATIKHDGHDFEADVEEIDTYNHKKTRTYETAIFSKNKFMIIRDQKNTHEDNLISFFQDVDVILLDGFKNSDYPKLEIIRSGNSKCSVCKKETILAIASNTIVDNIDEKKDKISIIDFNNIDKIVDILMEYIEGAEYEGHLQKEDRLY